MDSLELEDDYELCSSCQCNSYHCLCDVVGRALTKKTAQLYWLASTDIKKFNQLCDSSQAKKLLDE